MCSALRNRAASQQPPTPDITLSKAHRATRPHGLHTHRLPLNQITYLAAWALPRPVMQGTASPTRPGLRPDPIRTISRSPELLPFFPPRRPSASPWLRVSPLRLWVLYPATGVSPFRYRFGNPCWRNAS